MSPNLYESPSNNLETEIKERLSIPEKDFPPSEIVLGSRKGLNHIQNEDMALSMKVPGYELIGAFDGVGGYAGGAEASELASDFISNRYKEIGSSRIASMSLAGTAETMKEALMSADRFVRRKAQEKGNGMETTAALAQVWHDSETGEMKLIVSHVGDSRVLIIRNNEILSLTLDDSSMWKKMPDEEAIKVQNKFSKVENSNELNASEREMWNMRNIIYQALGRGDVTPTTEIFDICAGDIILTCTDGLTDNLTENEIVREVRNSRGAEQIPGRLIMAAEDRSKNKNHFRGKPDDITVGMIKTPELSSENVSKTESIPDLLVELRKYDGVWGSDGQKYHSFKRVYTDVQRVLGDESTITGVTRSAGLRDKVRQLLNLQE
jgi:serine/threonine protein phosphatase PrpC